MPDFSSKEREIAVVARHERASREIDLDILHVEMAHSADEIARALLGEPNRHLSTSRELRFGTHGSVCVPTSATTKAGTYYDHEADKGGSLLGLVQDACGLDFLESVQYLVQNCGVSQGIYKKGAGPDPEIARAISQEAFAERRRAAAAEDAKDREQRAANARVDWDAGVPLAGTPGETYLASRGISLDGLDRARFCEKDRALMLAFSDGDAFRGVQKTYLTAEGARRGTIYATKRSFGDLRGAGVVIPGDPSGPVVLAEGFETAASIAQATGFMVIACLGPRFADVALGAAGIVPEALQGRLVIIAADNDAPGSRASTRVENDAQRLSDEGLAVLVGRPQGYSWQKTGDKSDWNDALVQEGPNTVRRAFMDLVSAPAPNPETSSQMPPQTPDAEDLRAWWLEDFASDSTPEPDPYISRLLYPRSFMMVAGPPKSMKSLWVQHMMVSGASGEDFFGFTSPRPLRVFYINAEMDYFLFRRRVQDMNLPLWQLEKLSQNMLVTDRFKFLVDHNGGPKLVDLAHQYFGDNPPDVIVIDPLANIFPGEDENSNTEMMKFLTGNLEALREKINPDAALLVVHHAAKALAQQRQAGGVDPFNAIRGAGALRGYYDTGIVIERVSYEDNLRRISFDTRRDEAPPVAFTRFHEGRFTIVEAPEGPGKANSIAKETAAHGKYAHIQNVISEGLRETGSFLSRKQFASKYAQTGGLGSSSTIQNTLSEMIAKEEIRYLKVPEIEAMTEDFSSYAVLDDRVGYLAPIGSFQVAPKAGPYAGQVISVGS